MKIEKYLILNKYLLSLFGFDDVRDLLDELKDKSEGVDSDGRSYFVNALRGIENIKVDEDALLRYDENIQSYVSKINYTREPVSLKYFQYLAVLFTEIVLDKLKNRKEEFLSELNEFLRNYKQEQEIEIVSEFTEDDLRKIAFWMATGSGKTLIMHINYYQFFHYNLLSPDNILLITPNEGLSKQHYEELRKSGIPCRLYSEGAGKNSLFRSEEEVLVIEMTKFVEEKKGGGVTLPVETFEGKNLVFVDEGHKGRRSEEQKWVKLRNKLSKDGFVFEYSATFGQILSERNKETLEEYAKSIIFDYSYKYFYLDGYGKDFSVLNVKQVKISEQDFQNTMFVAGLLSFYEQILVYEDNEKLAKEHNIEKPLWIFVGTTVTGKKEQSDVVKIVEFIKKVNEDENWLKEQIDRILNGKTKLKGEDGNDVFAEKFGYLGEKNFDSGEMCNDIYQKIFGGRGILEIYELKNAEGEFGLKVGEGKYFGVINIGDVLGFKKQLEHKGISVEQDVITGSLFDDIKRENSKINILIGSKKFIEGWDTWRVSCMCLLNIGTGQGPQIIQLFGRGVRLKGKNMSLKRSEDNLPIRPLETLGIYGIKADYLNKFLDAIQKEEVEFETIKIPVKPLHKKKWGSLCILSKKSNRKFEDKKILKLEIDDTINFTLDLLPKVTQQVARKREKEGIITEQAKADVEELTLPDQVIDLLNWEKIWQEICEFKVTRGYWNLVLDKKMLKEILSQYKVRVSPEIMEVRSEEDLSLIEEIAIQLIKKYLDSFYRKEARLFETENLKYGEVKEQLPLFVFERSGNRYSYTVQVNKQEKELIKEIKNLANNLKRLFEIEEIAIQLRKNIWTRTGKKQGFLRRRIYMARLKKQLLLFVFERSGNRYSYTVQVNKQEKELIKEIKNLANNLKRLFEDDKRTLPRVYFDRHLYVPILLKDKSKKIHKISPAGLVESEEKFISGLKEYLSNNKDKFSNVEIYLLRNFPKSGVGFQLQWSSFYPDFIMWIKESKKQTIVFIDPKGLEHTKGLDDEKIVFAGYKSSAGSDVITIKDIQQRLSKNNVTLESFILSITPYRKLIEGLSNPPQKCEYIKRHVLFLEDEDWAEQLFKLAGVW